MTLEERAREVLASALGDSFRSGYVRDGANEDRGHIIRPSESIAAMLAFAAEERERCARVAEDQRYAVTHPGASMDHEMEMHDDGCIAAATAIRNLEQGQ